MEKLADPWSVEPRLLHEASTTTEAARRMALVMAHFVAGVCVCVHVRVRVWLQVKHWS